MKCLKNAALYLKELLPKLDLGRGNKNWIQSLISRVKSLDLSDHIVCIYFV